MASARVLIIGAGAMGTIVGHVLQTGGAAITFLVRPKRSASLARPQVLYSYDDNRLERFSDYTVITSPGDIERDAWDFIVFTIDGIALRSAEGRELVRTVGGAARDTKTSILIGTIGVNLRPGFLQLSGLAENQVFGGGLFIAVYQTDRVSLPIHPPVDVELLAQADFAYRQHTPIGLFIDNSAPAAAEQFAKHFGASGKSQCVILSPQEYSTQVPAVFPVFAACSIVGWRGWQELAADSQLCELMAAAVREVQGLSINGDVGKKAQAVTTADSLIEFLRRMEEETLPLDFLAFNRFHHGGKVFEQDMELLEDCARLGEAENLPMSALRELIGRARDSRVSSGIRGNS